MHIVKVLTELSNVLTEYGKEVIEYVWEFGIVGKVVGALGNVWE